MISTTVQQIEQAVDDDRVRGGSMTRRRLVEAGRDSSCASYVTAADTVVHAAG
jgi:hypothetical protein